MSGLLRVLTPGASEIPYVELIDGEPTDPFTIGYAKDWIVRGPGVLPAHALVYFDGAHLHMSSADEEAPVIVDGAALPMSWTVIDRSCRFLIGGVEMAFASMGEEALARTQDGTGQRATTQRSSRRREPPRWPWAIVGAVLSLSIGMSLHLHPTGGARPVRRDEAPAARAATTAAAASASSEPAAPSLALAAQASVVVHPVSHPASAATGKTLERLAADALHVGDRARALRLYRDLIARQPDNVAFEAAERILGAVEP